MLSSNQHALALSQRGVYYYAFKAVDANNHSGKRGVFEKYWQEKIPQIPVTYYSFEAYHEK